MIFLKLEKEEQKIEELDREWDCIVIGGGCAGYTAALYLVRYGLKTLVISKDVGGNLNEASIVENYPTIVSIKGSELGELFKNHAEKFGAKTLIDEVVDVIIENEKFKIVTASGYEFLSKAVIFSTGSRRKKLGIAGENLGGVSYCAECDAAFFKDKVVGVVGGGNSAFHDALVLSYYAKKVYIIHRRDEFKAEKYLIDSALQNPKIEILTNKVVKEIRGSKKVEEVILEDTKTKEVINLKLDGLFVAIGLEANSELARKIGVEVNEKGEIIVDEYMRTNVKGVLAAGDVTNFWNELKLIITASALGAVAAYSAYNYIKHRKWK